MAKLFITNAFSINMLSASSTLSFIPLHKDLAKGKIKMNYDNFEFIPCVGHADIANIVKTELNLNMELFNRISVTPDFNNGDALLVAQYTGVRLPEGTTQLPEGASIKYWYVCSHEYY